MEESKKKQVTEHIPVSMLGYQPPKKKLYIKALPFFIIIGMFAGSLLAVYNSDDLYLANRSNATVILPDEMITNRFPPTVRHHPLASAFTSMPVMLPPVTIAAPPCPNSCRNTCISRNPIVVCLVNWQVTCSFGERV